MFKNKYTGINDINNNPIHNGMKVLIIDRNIIGEVRYSISRAEFRVFYNQKKNQEDKTISVANSGNIINNNLKIIEK